MSNKDRGYEIGFTNTEVVTRGDGTQALEGDFIVASSDEQMEEEALEVLHDFAEENGIELSEKPQTGGGSQHFVGASKWKANWQPTGPKPPWAGEQSAN